MPELGFQLRGAAPIRNAAAPTVGLQLEIVNQPPDELIHSMVLNCQLQIEASRRHYTAAEQARLRDLFDEPERWGQTLRPLLWTNLTTTVPAFTGGICIQLAVPCTFDLDIPATKYFHGVDAPAVPVSALFSGSIFYRTPDNLLQAAPIPWNSEARFAFPASVWKQCIDLYRPNTATLALRRDVFERLYEFKVRQGLATFDDAIEQMMETALGARA